MFFISGGIDEEIIYIKIISQPGYAIKSIFEFCGERKIIMNPWGDKANIIDEKINVILLHVNKCFELLK